MLRSRMEGAMGNQDASVQPGEASAGEAENGPLSTARVLRHEAEAIHGKELPETMGAAELYRQLHGLNSSALCLSGGGIRSASFALGVIEALATHPRQSSTPQGIDQDELAKKSLLSQFHYLSTVSGGGYIGSWLSAWIAREGYAKVWPKLIGRRDERPEVEPSEIAWLRSYSNYLTPRVGLFSADTWTAAALYVRNLILNWLVILPALCLALLAVKGFAAGVFLLPGTGRYAAVAFVALGAVLMIWVLAFALLNRPSRNPCQVLGQASGPQPSAAATRSATGSDARDGTSDRSVYTADPLRNERALHRAGADEKTFIVRCLVPAAVAALLLSLYMWVRGTALVPWPLWKTVGLALLVGVAVYALSWVVTWPPGKWVPCEDEPGKQEERGALYWWRDFAAWLAAGAVYGALIGLGVYVVAHFDLWFAIANVQASASVSSPTGYFLIALIYGVPWLIAAQLTAEMIFVGVTNWQRFSDADREWFGRSTGWFAVTAIMWFAVMFLVLIASHAAWDWVRGNDWARYGSSLLAVGSALFTTLAGGSGKSAATDQANRKSGLLMRVAPPVAAIVFLLLLVLAVSAAIDYLLFDKSLLRTSLLAADPATSRREDWKWLGIGFLVVGFVALIAWTHVNINRFSIYALYRNRLIRAYLGASNPNRAPNPFTGFDDADNPPMAALWTASKEAWQPFQVVNIALNVVNSKRLAWQERKAVSFTATPLHCGTASNDLGYRPTARYGGGKYGGLSLGTAFAISGAAASPNMGYHSSPLVTLLLALFNVRLGWWLGNPGRPGDQTYDRDGPNVAIRPFIAEMFGQTTDDRRYVYLSDGGHFENLGLYEMIRRRCRCIVVSDAGCDPDYAFEDLGNAVRKVAIDLGVSLTFGELRKIKGRSKDNTVIEGAYYAIGEIDYRSAPENQPGSSSPHEPKAEAQRRAAVENGYILYIKPSYHGSETAGIVAYATKNAAFPHETTGDQFFSESQFESYRTLGFEIMDGVLNDAIENVETITQAAKASLSANRLCDLVRALDPKLVKAAEDALKPARPKASDILKLLDADDLNAMRASSRPRSKGRARARHTSTLAASAFSWMNSRRGSTTSPISLVNRSSASSTSLTFTCRSERAWTSRVVSHSWPGFISPRPL